MDIQRVELDADVSIYCPFCGRLVVDNSDREDLSNYLKPCKHTLFFAHDEGFEYRSAEFDANLGIEKIEDEAIDLPEGGYDGLTDRVNIAGSVKFAAYEGAPSGFGAYVGFAPSYD